MIHRLFIFIMSSILCASATVGVKGRITISAEGDPADPDDKADFKAALGDSRDAGASVSGARGKNGTPARVEDGFASIFNGKNLEGWRVRLRKDDDPELKKKVFSVEDGVIHVFKGIPAGFDSDAEPGDRRTCGVLLSDQIYTNYIFRFEYKWGTKSVNCPQELNLNSGAFYHVTRDTVWPKGIEFQLKYDHKQNRDNSGAVLRGGNTFTWYSADASSNTFLSPAEGGVAVANRLKGGWFPRPVESVPEQALDWNQCEIVVMGSNYALHKLNGKIVNLITDISAGEGRIGLQAEFAEIFFRALEIKEVDAPIPLANYF